MELTLDEARLSLAKQAQSQALQDMGLELPSARVLCPPEDDSELQAIIAREKQFIQDSRVPAAILKEKEHMDAIDQKIEQLVYSAKIDTDTVYELGLLTILLHHHLERIDGTKNPLAIELLDIFKNLKK